MEIVYDESTGTWSEREEPYTTLDVQTEEDWNKLEFMINNFSRLEEENKELKRLLLLALDDFAVNYINYCDCLECSDCPYHVDIEQFEGCSTRWKHLDEAVQILGDDADCWR